MFGLNHANQLFTQYLTQLPARGPSPNVWKKAYHSMTAPDGRGGWLVADDFTLFQDVTTTAAAATHPVADTAHGGTGYQVYADIGGSISRVTDESGGVVQIIPGNADNEQTQFFSGYLGQISDVAADAKLTIFEARVKLQAIAAGSTFFGLGSAEGVGASSFSAAGELDNGGSNDVNLVGFRTLDATPADIDFVVQDAAATATVTITDVQTAVADTYYKLALVYDPAASDAKAISVYVDNVEQTTYVTKTDGVFAGTFPNADMLGVLLGGKDDAGGGSDPAIDWWAFYQEH